MSNASDLANFNTGIEVWLKRVRNMTTELYQEMVWDLFLTVVRETPQWSGKAVANWNISIGSVGDEYNDDYGDPVTSADAHQKGDRKWESVAWNRNRPIKNSIKLNDKVFIYNWTTGDDGGPAGGSQISYLEGFQSSPDWPTKLREVNRPYETVQQSVMIVTARWANRGMNMNPTRGDRYGGPTLDGS